MAYNFLPVPPDGTFVSGVYTAGTGTLLTNTLASAILSEYVAKHSFDNVSVNLFFLSWLTKAKDQKKIVSEGGATVSVPLNYSLNGAFKGMHKFDEIDTTLDDFIRNAVYTKKLVAGPIVLNDIDLATNQGDQGKMLDLLRESTQVAEKSLADVLGQQLGGGAAASSARDIDGLKHLLRFTPTNTVGTIDRSVAAGTFYQNQTAGINDFSNEAAAGFPILIRTIRQCSMGADRPDLLLCDPTAFEHFNAEYVNKSSLTVVDETMANLGFVTTTFQGITIGYDDYVSAETGAGGYLADADVGVIYVLNSNSLRLVVQKGYDMEMIRPLTPVPVQFIQVAILAFYGALVATNMQRLGVIGIQAW